MIIGNVSTVMNVFRSTAITNTVLVRRVPASIPVNTARIMSSAVTWSLSGCRICSGGSFGRFATVRTSNQFNSTSGGILTAEKGIEKRFEKWYNVTGTSYIKIAAIA